MNRVAAGVAQRGGHDRHLYFIRPGRPRKRVRPMCGKPSGSKAGTCGWIRPRPPPSAAAPRLTRSLAPPGAILVVWSGYSRGSEYVAPSATGLYKNKLIRVRVDGSVPRAPSTRSRSSTRPVVRRADDPHWRKIVAAVRLLCGRQRGRRRHGGRHSPRRSISNRRGRWRALLIAAGVLVLGARACGSAIPLAGVRQGEVAGEIDAATTEAVLAGRRSEMQPPVACSRIRWNPATAGRASGATAPTGCAIHVVEFLRASNAETARSLLRVLDAQAWVQAVTLDNEQAYQGYLKRIPGGRRDAGRHGEGGA